jgi:predicted amidohydrolase
VERASLHLALGQFAPCLGDPAANLTRIGDLAHSCGADLLLTPELSVTGYDLRSDARRFAVPVSVGDPLVIDGGMVLADTPCGVVLGLIERGADGIPYNTGILLEHGVVRHRHRKVYLPTYGMFDEGRYFGRGQQVATFSPAPGWTAGLLICEDFWHPALAWLLAVSGIDVLLVQAAAPGRGVWDASDDGADTLFASWSSWERIARVTAELYGVYVALANRSGVEGGVTFAGGSMLVAPTGQVLAQAPPLGDTVLHAELTAHELERARTPFAHARDEDPALVARELKRLGRDA